MIIDHNYLTQQSIQKGKIVAINIILESIQLSINQQHQHLESCPSTQSTLGNHV